MRTALQCVRAHTVRTDGTRITDETLVKQLTFDDRSIAEYIAGDC